MLKLSSAQLDGPVLANRRRLIQDVENHLLDCCPAVVAAYPRPYLRWLIGEGVDLTRALRFDDVASVRLFVRLRWTIAPGFYKQPQIARVLQDLARPSRERFDLLATPAFAAAWEAACDLDGPREWRSGFWLADNGAAA